jgi:hypothetical protein
LFLCLHPSTSSHLEICHKVGAERRPTKRCNAISSHTLLVAHKMKKFRPVQGNNREKTKLSKMALLHKKENWNIFKNFENIFLTTRTQIFCIYKDFVLCTAVQTSFTAWTKSRRMSLPAVKAEQIDIRVFCSAWTFNTVDVSTSICICCAGAKKAVWTALLSTKLSAFFLTSALR